MSEGKYFREALSLLLSGRRKEAAAKLLPLYEHAISKHFRIQVIDALLSALNPIQDNQKLVELASEGIGLANELGTTNFKAHFMSRKADLLMRRVDSYQYQRASLKLIPDWFVFSLEIDKNKYENLTKAVEGLEIDIEKLLADALALAQATGDKKVLAFILMSKASIGFSHFMHYKMGFLRDSGKAKLSLFLHKLGFEIPILFGYKYYRSLRLYVNSFSANLLAAARLFKEIDDEQAAFAYFDLAICLRSAYRFRGAIKYLRKAEDAAKLRNNTLLLAQIRALKKSIWARNRDVPDYLEGEAREEITI